MGSDRDKESGQITAQFSTTVLTRICYAAVIIGVIAIAIGLAFPLLLGVN